MTVNLPNATINSIKLYNSLGISVKEKNISPVGTPSDRYSRTGSPHRVEETLNIVAEKLENPTAIIASILHFIRGDLANRQWGRELGKQTGIYKKLND